MKKCKVKEGKRATKTRPAGSHHKQEQEWGVRVDGEVAEAGQREGLTAVGKRSSTNRDATSREKHSRYNSRTRNSDRRYSNRNSKRITTGLQITGSRTEQRQ